MCGKSQNVMDNFTPNQQIIIRISRNFQKSLRLRVSPENEFKKNLHVSALPRLNGTSRMRIAGYAISPSVRPCLANIGRYHCVRLFENRIVLLYRAERCSERRNDRDTRAKKFLRTRNITSRNSIFCVIKNHRGLWLRIV